MTSVQAIKYNRAKKENAKRNEVLVFAMPSQCTLSDFETLHVKKIHNENSKFFLNNLRKGQTQELHTLNMFY